MTISAIHNSPTLSQTTPLRHMVGTLNTFLYSIPTLLVSFLALQSTDFSSTLEKPPVRARCSRLNPFKPQDTTPIWTNEIGQVTLNAEDVDGSYMSYAEAFKEPLTEWIQEMNRIASKSSDPAEQALEHSLTISTDHYIPQELQLDGALKKTNIDYDPYKGSRQLSSVTIERDPKLSALSRKTLEILRTWYPGDEISIHSLEVLNGHPGVKHRDLALHIDNLYFTVLTIPSSEFPLSRNGIWITTTGEMVRLKTVYETTDEIEVTVLESPDSFSGETKTLRKKDLDYHACVSGKTTQMIPGLVFNESLGYSFSLNNLNDLQSQMTQHAQHLLKYSVQLPAEASLLLPANQQVHSVPSYESEPNDLALKNCSEIYRKKLNIFYERNSKISNSSSFVYSIFRLLLFLSRCADTVVDTLIYEPWIFILICTIRSITMPATNGRR